MREWLESNRVGPQRRLRQLHCPTCRKPARESDLGRIFVEAVVLDEDAEYQSRLMNSIAEQTNSARNSLQTITPTSSAVQVTRAISDVVQSQNALSTSKYSETEPIVRTVTEVSVTSFSTRRILTLSRNYRKSQMTSKTAFVPCLREWRTRTRRLCPSEWRCVGRRSSGLLPTIFQTVRLKERLQSVDLEKQQVQHYLEEALVAGERMKENRDSVKLTALQKAQEAETLSREVARLTRQSFAKGNEIADLKEQCNERQAEIERLNEVISLFQCLPSL